MSESKIDTTEATDKKIQAWVKATKDVESTKARYQQSVDSYNEIHRDLGKWLVPEDVEVGESFNIWYGDGLIKLEVLTNSNYKITWRQRPANLI